MAGYHIRSQPYCNRAQLYTSSSLAAYRSHLCKKHKCSFTPQFLLFPIKSSSMLFRGPLCVKLRSCRRLDEIEAGVCAPARFHPKENCIFLALLCSYPFAAPAQDRSAQHSAPRRRAKLNTIPDRSSRAILLGGLFVWR